MDSTSARGAATQGFLYALVGAAASLSDWFLFGMAHDVFGVHYVAAAAMSLVAATLLNYVLSVRYVFISGRFRRSLEIFLVYSVSTVGMGLNIGFMIMFVELSGLAPLPAKMAATCMVFSWNFLARRYLVFGRGAPVSGRFNEMQGLSLPGRVAVQPVPVSVYDEA